jgi:hypothetical protein
MWSAVGTLGSLNKKGAQLTPSCILHLRRLPAKCSTPTNK